MRAVTIVDNHLVVAERHIDEVVADQLVVEVAGAGINRGDLMQVAGRYPPPPGVPADIPGLEFAGTVRATGPLVRSFRPVTRSSGSSAAARRPSSSSPPRTSASAYPQASTWSRPVACRRCS